jgi:hypothetical protein
MDPYSVASVLMKWGFVGLTGGLGAYLGAYLKAKGEKLATREDFEELKRQTAALAQATKEIDTKISGELWDRQKRWELRRDLVFDAAKKSAEAKAALFKLDWYYSKVAGGLQTEGSMIWDRAHQDFENAVTAASIVCGKKLLTALVTYAVFLNDTGKAILEGGNIDDNSHDRIAELHTSLYNAMREELEKPTTFQSGGSSLL